LTETETLNHNSPSKAMFDNRADSLCRIENLR